MSVPLPSPSPLSPANPSTAKPIPRSRPQPISTGSGSPSINLSRSPLYREVSPGSPASPSSSLRKKTAKSIGFNAAGPASEDNWRERSSSVTSAPRSAVRTVGGFEKPKASLQPVKSAKEDGAADKDSDKAPALSHVPCRFFKAGACTAGSSCQFSHEDGGKREVCQWFLKGNCKFGHKCALAHVRPGEPMSMDRKNKKAAQAETRGAEGKSPAKGDGFMEAAATPVPIRSALSSSIQSPPAHRLPSSPLREPYGPPAVGPTGGSSPGFSKSPAPLSVFAASPSRPSPLSGSYGASKSAIPGSLSLKAVNQHSPLRPPATAFSSSFSHASIREVRSGTSPAPPLSASFADGMRKNIWARHETSTDKPEVLSPRRPINQIPQHSDEDYFNGELEDEDHGEDLIPSSLSDLLTPRERARRMSRRDSIESSSASPGRPGQPAGLWSGHGERLAQSAGPTMGPGFLQGLWSAEGGDARKDGVKNQSPTTPGPDGTFGYAGNGGSKSSLLSQMRSPNSPGAFASAQNGSPISAWSPSKGQSAVAITPMDTAPSPYAMRQAADPSSPSARALQEHNPGQSLPGGLASALSRLHMKGPVSNRTSGLTAAGDLEEGDERRSSAAHTDKADDRDDDELFTMDG